MSWAVFFDRDGVLTDAPIVDGKAAAALDAAEMVILPGAAEAVALTHELGGLAFVVTNQPDVARGKLAIDELDRMHCVLAAKLSVDAIRACTHDGVDRCRKPAPGMLLDLATEHDVDLSASFMIGDRWVDIAAGSAAGTTTILIDRDYSWVPTSAGGPPPDLEPDHRVRDVLHAVWVLRGVIDARHPEPHRGPRRPQTQVPSQDDSGN